MGRRRSGQASGTIDLPEGVHAVRARGKVYYYWQPGRGTKAAGARLRLPDDPHSPEFWQALRAHGAEASRYAKGTVGDLVERYRISQDFLGLAESTRTTYAVHLDRFANKAAWGDLRVKDLKPAGVMAARDAMAETPVMANHMLSFGGTLWGWAIPLGLAEIDPFEHVKPLRVEDRGHVPWPGWVLAYVLEHAPEDLARMARLGTMTCMRESDLIRLGPQHREDAGIWCRPVKTRRKRRAFRIPLATADALELDRWAERPMRFVNPRFKAPAEQHREDLYLYSPRGSAYTTEGLRSRWHRWLAGKAGEQLCARWREWLAGQVERYDWEIDPEDVKGPTIHGLRGTGILIRRRAGYEPAQIANDIGMHPNMVEHYMRFRDQVEVSEQGRAKVGTVIPIR
ncbi:MAG: putative phage integrase [Xanthobacteraceae bacterium]|jgi:integrase|nr:putative phage integrase [Xanthobacteraceae bacterium]